MKAPNLACVHTVCVCVGKTEMLTKTIVFFLIFLNEAMYNSPDYIMCEHLVDYAILMKY